MYAAILTAGFFTCLPPFLYYILCFCNYVILKTICIFTRHKFCDILSKAPAVQRTAESEKVFYYER